MKFTVSAVAAAFAFSSEVSSFSTPKPVEFRNTRTSSLNANDNADLDVDCVVVGGGISGSTLAHNINFQSSGDVSVILTEARDYIGGNVKSHRTEDGFLWEEGPNSFAAQPSIVRISYELGIDDQLVFADESLPPWVNHNGKLHPLPKGQGGKGPKGQLELVFGRNGVLKFGLTGELLSWPGKIRAGIGALVGHLPPPEDKEENIREWVTRILGEEVFLRCIDPFVSGVYAGDPQTLSMKAALSKINRIESYAYNIDWNKFGAIFYGGLARQVELTKERKADPPKPEWVEFEYGNPGSYREGLATLPNAIAKNLGDKVKTEWKLLTIENADENTEGYKYIATYETPEGTKTVKTKTIISTIPAHALQGSVLENVMPSATKLLNTIRSNVLRKGVYHPPVAAVTVAYPKSSFKDVELPNGFGNLQNLPGFGSLNPRTEGTRTLGTLWSSSLFPGRCPEDYNLLLNYIGGSRDVGLKDLTDEEIIGEVDKGCRQVLLKPNAPEPKVVGMKVWPQAIPQYELGHLEIMDELREIEKDVDGLWVCGNYRTGVAFPDCVTFGYDHAKVVINHLNDKNKAESTLEAPEVKAEPVVTEEEKIEEPVVAGSLEEEKAARREADAKVKAEAEAVKAEADAKEEEAKATAQAEAEAKKAEAEADAKKEEAKAAAQAEADAKKAEEEAEADAKKEEAEAASQAEAKKAEAEADAKKEEAEAAAQAEAKKAEAEADAKKAEAEAAAQAEAEADAKKEEAKAAAQAEADAKKAEADAKKEEAKAAAQVEADAKKAEAAAKEAAKADADAKKAEAAAAKEVKAEAEAKTEVAEEKEEEKIEEPEEKIEEPVSEVVSKKEKASKSKGKILKEKSSSR